MARKAGSFGDITGPRVREAALRLFATQGYSAVSMRQLAAEVGVQAGALYLYTPDKEMLLCSLIETHLRERLAAWDAVVLPAGAAERLEAFVRFHIRFQRGQPDRVTMAALERRNLSQANRAILAGLDRDYAARLAQVLEQGVQDRVFTVPDTPLAVAAILALLDGIAPLDPDASRLTRGRIERIGWNMVRRAVGG